MQDTQQSLTTMYFNRGAFVSWQDVCGDEAITRHGIIECEMTNRPGWYYVRNEHGDLEIIHWAELALARRKST